MLNTGLAFFASSNFSAGRTNDAVHTVLPASLGVTPRLNNTQMEAWLSQHLPGLTNYNKQMVGDIPWLVDEEQRYIVVHYYGQGNTVVGTYRDEYMWALELTEDGTEVQESWEYVDSELYSAYEARVHSEKARF